ncbi:MAG: methionine gamma-lyase family protein [Paenibacillaceae bacterium]|nr:methionine gamma-lyase family protein [Paenibacillaceae bacterium]
MHMETIINDVRTIIAQRIAPVCADIRAREWRLQERALQAFHAHRVSSWHMHGSTGYGYGDVGRETLERVYATVFGAEAALVRPHIASGTHAIAVALFGMLRPGDTLVFATGTPYDTLLPVLGSGPGSLQAWGVQTRIVPLASDGSVDFDAVQRALSGRVGVVAVQRARGYARRPAVSIASIDALVQCVRAHAPLASVFVDNCYGEWVEDVEPTHVGADVCAGSLIKNAGGGIAPTGGYVVGKAELIGRIAERLYAPGVAGAIGAYDSGYRAFFQGLWMAPHSVAQAMEGAVFAAALFAHLGYDVDPLWDQMRADSVQTIAFDNEKQLCTFVQTIQQSSPIDAHVCPTPGPMPGYACDIIMAGGTFVQGASSELSADAPLRPPYTAFVQGGLSAGHVATAMLRAAARLGHEECAVGLRNIR